MPLVLPVKPALKPDPLMLAEILAETGISAHEAIMVGDTSYDLEMAMNIAMPSVGVTYGVHTPETLAQFNPLSIVNDVSSLHDFYWLKSMERSHLIQYLSHYSRSGIF